MTATRTCGNDASQITVNQYNVTQMERLIRNELQVASNIDVDLLASFNSMGTHFDDIVENDEYMMFDSVRNEVAFKRADSSGNFNTVFTIDDVTDVTLSVAPLNDTVDDKEGQPYKLFYKVSTSHYDYSGGFVLNNTKIGSDDSMNYCGTTNKTIHWGNSATNDNDYVFYYHREITGVESTSP